MELLEPGFAVAETTGVTIGRLRPPADPLIDAAVDQALHDAEWPVLELDVPEWDQATADAGLLLVVEAWESNRALVARDPEGIGDRGATSACRRAPSFDAATVAAGMGRPAGLAAHRMTDLFEQVDFLVTPTLSIFPPLLDDGTTSWWRAVAPFRSTWPVSRRCRCRCRRTGRLPASIQLIGPGAERGAAAGGRRLAGVSDRRRLTRRRPPERRSPDWPPTGRRSCWTRAWPMLGQVPAHRLGRHAPRPARPARPAGGPPSPRSGPRISTSIRPSAPVAPSTSRRPEHVAQDVRRCPGRSARARWPGHAARRAWS